MSDCANEVTRPCENAANNDRHLRMAGDGAPATPSFRTLLFPPGMEDADAWQTDEPACFPDLNLDQIVGAIVEKRNEPVLRPIFYSAYRDENIVRYRQATFSDLERSEIFDVFPPFCEAMGRVRANLDYAEKISRASHRAAVILRAAWTYCQTISSLLKELQPLALRSPGLSAFRDYVATYVASHAFVELARQASELRNMLSEVSYGMLFRGDSVTVRRYASEPDYTATILKRFAKFREAEPPPPTARRPSDDFSLNHIEQGILEFVGRLFPNEFRRLGDFVVRQSGFVDDVIARFDREIDFFVSYVNYIAPLKTMELTFCYPEVSVSAKETRVVGGFDLALAAKLLKEKAKIVRNDFRLSGAERLIVVSGPNQGGKTTFARMFGQLHFLASLGCPIPGRSAQLFLPDRIFTHFEREEDITNLRGKLEDELVRLHQSCAAMSSDSVIVLNEIFSSTSLDDQIFLSTKVLGQILATDAIGVCVTFIDTLSTLSEKTVSMVSTVYPDDPSRRTFEIVRKPADGLAYALSLAQKRGVTYEQLLARIRS